ncbi:hypothetical protein Efla_003757 [Eimeria flavescens]
MSLRLRPSAMGGASQAGRPLRGLGRCVQRLSPRLLHTCSPPPPGAAAGAAAPSGRRSLVGLSDKAEPAGVAAWSARRPPSLSIRCGLLLPQTRWGPKRQVANFAEATAAANAVEDAESAAEVPGKIQTFSDMLEEEDSLSGLSENYNNQRTLGSLLSRRQMQNKEEKARHIERVRVASPGLSPAACRQVEYRNFIPSLARRIPFEEYYLLGPPTTSNRSLKKQGNAHRVTLLEQIPLSQAIAALVANSPSLYVDSDKFCDCLENLVFAEVFPGGPLNPKDRNKIRAILGQAFAEMQTSGNELADAFDLILGLCQFCRSDDDERMKATFALFDNEGRGRLHFFVVAGVFHHLHRILLTPYVVDMFRRARVTFNSVDDLAVASAVEVFRMKYPFLGDAAGSSEKGNISAAATATATRAAATPAAAAAAAAACAHNKLFIDLTEEPWKSAACHAGLELSYEDFVRVCEDTPKIASMTQRSLLRLPLIVALRDLIDANLVC